MLHRGLTLFALLALAAFPLPGAVVFYSGYDAGRSATIRINVDGQDEDHESGVMLIQLDGSWSTAAFCADLFTGIAAGQSYNTGVSEPGTTVMQRLAWMISNILPTIPSGGATAQAQGAALQLAIWDIIHDNGDGLGSGRVQQSVTTAANVVTFTNSYLAAPWVPASGLMYLDNAFVPSGLPAQDMLAMVPEPETASVVLLGLLAGIVLRRLTPPKTV